MLKFIDSMARLTPSQKKIIVLLSDAVLCYLATVFAFFLRLDLFNFIGREVLVTSFISYSLIILIFVLFEQYTEIVRHQYSTILRRGNYALILYGLFFWSIVTLWKINGVPRTIGLLQPLLFALMHYFIRVLFSILYSRTLRAGNPDRKNVLIYGVSKSADQFVEFVNQSNHYKIIGFIDDRKELAKRRVSGLKIFASDAIKAIVKTEDVRTVLLSSDIISKYRQYEIVEELKALDVKTLVLPSSENIVLGMVNVNTLREVSIEDILGREEVPPLLEIISLDIESKTVLVTGAGGSIGSEICRQVLKFKPKKLIAIEINEYSLYKLLNQFSDYSCEVVTYLGDCGDRSLLSEILTIHNVDTVYHAAAYKHVPIVESNIIAAVKNNVFVTDLLVEQCSLHKVKTFVLISSDKAVRPTNIMGATKRIAELIVKSVSANSQRGLGCKFKYCIVRFGNVIGSSGSVIPLFKKQIESGGPVTVTSREIIRYFMTIPEASQLVIQAGALGSNGSVLLLDMGEPENIYKIAERMIKLAGLTEKNEENVNGDIEIKITGLRPGEKLFEELLISEDAHPTSHERIFYSDDVEIDPEFLAHTIYSLKFAVKKRNVAEVIRLLSLLVPEATLNHS